MNRDGCISQSGRCGRSAPYPSVDGTQSRTSPTRGRPRPRKCPTRGTSGVSSAPCTPRERPTRRCPTPSISGSNGMSPRPLFPFSDFQRLFSHHLFHIFPTQKGPDPFSTRPVFPTIETILEEPNSPYGTSPFISLGRNPLVGFLNSGSTEIPHVFNRINHASFERP